MILIYSHSSPKRLQYICKFIFKEQLGIPYSLTIDAQGFSEHTGPRINYSNEVFEGFLFNILPAELLFETGIRQQNISCFKTNGIPAFYKKKASDYPFDIFAACFYLLSRYEEYLPHEKDMYGRYAHENSLAYKEGFLNQPLINIWMSDFAKRIKIFFPSIIFKLPEYKFLPTYDIDIAWSFKNKGLLRNLGGFIKRPSLTRLAVLAGIRQDPYNSYEFLNDLHKETRLEPIYFFLVAKSRSKYDKNISPLSSSMWQLIRQHAKRVDIGLHPSWKSNDNVTVLKKEKSILASVANVSINRSRQHYIKFSLPETFERLLEAGIENDYSMGYGSINGFRASVASSFNWYNLKKESPTRLIMHPFCYMDANSFYEENLGTEEAYKEMVHYMDMCKKYHGTLITIFHNNFLGTDKKFSGWREIYSRFTSQALQ